MDGSAGVSNISMKARREDTDRQELATDAEQPLSKLQACRIARYLLGCCAYTTIMSGELGDSI